MAALMPTTFQGSLQKTSTFVSGYSYCMLLALSPNIFTSNFMMAQSLISCACAISSSAMTRYFSVDHKTGRSPQTTIRFSMNSLNLRSTMAW